MNIAGKTALVTGAAGFIGSHLVQELVAEGVKVKALVHYNFMQNIGNLIYLSDAERAQVDIIFGDVTDSAFLRTVIKGCDLVFHLAALIGIPYSYVAPYSYVNTNVNGSLNIFQTCLELGIEKVIHTSTSESYGTAQYTPIDEKHPLQGQSPYSATKIGADFLAESYHRSFNLPVATIRPFNTYGPRQSMRAIIPTVLSQLILGNKEVRVGSLDPVRDFTYVKDTARGFVAIAKSPESIGKVINIGTGSSVSIGEFIQLSMSLLGVTAEIVTENARVRPKNSEVMELLCDNQLAKKLLDWAPTYTFSQGVSETIAFIKKNIDSYKHTNYIV